MTKMSQKYFVVTENARGTLFKYLCLALSSKEVLCLSAISLFASIAKMYHFQPYNSKSCINREF